MNPQRNIPEINQLYISRRCNLPNFSVRKMHGYSYMSNGIMHNTGLVPIYRYAQDVVINKVTVCAMFLTLDSDEGKAEKWFKKAITKAKKEQSVKDLIKTLIRLPVKVGITYER